jgi:allantoate deiminase
MPAAVSAERIWDRCEQLARCSEDPDRLTRVFLSEAQAAASRLVLGWMREAGMAARVDAIGNVVGRYEGDRPGLPCLMLGSHLDTVRDAGKYDGMLGVVTAIECVASLDARAKRLPYAVEVVGFADEEGVRFGVTLLGSHAIAGTFDPRLLDATDSAGVSMRQALRDGGFDPARIPDAARRRDEILAYAELHIEQGPVLEAEGLPAGVVTAINGFSRYSMAVTGIAGHAGTVPMPLRRDAFAGAAECALAVERIASRTPDLVGTVGRCEVLPGAMNVIPGSARFTVDLRSPRDADRLAAVRDVLAECRAICDRRRLRFDAALILEQPTTPCAPWLMDQMAAAIAAEGVRLHRLPSGAGHDGMAMRAVADICMVFVRCALGVSHNPAEAITLGDAGTGARVLARFIEGFRPRT